jgi:hypothetical protein
MKIKIPYKLGLVLMIAGASLTACDKEEPDPTQAKINALNAEIKTLDNQVRDAFEPARTQPYPIYETFDATFAEEEIKLFGRKALNIKDSCETIIPTAERFKQWKQWGNPENVAILKDLAQKDLSKRAELDLLTKQK